MDLSHIFNQYIKFESIHHGDWTCRAEIWFKISAPPSTLTALCQWEDETSRQRTGHPPSYAKAKKN